MRKTKVRRLEHIILNIAEIILSITAGFLLTYKIFNIYLDINIILINILSCIIGSTIYLIFVMLIHKNKGHRHEKFKLIFNALDRISNGDFSVFIENDDRHGHDHIMSELIARVNNMARQLSSMETMRQDFVSNVSHEIQSPLTSIMGFSALLKNDSLPYKEKNDYLNIIDMEAKRLSKLSDNLLKLSALDSGAKELQLRKYNLDRQIKDIILSMEPQWSKKNIEFEINCPHTFIYADKELMGEVWINLLNNGIKFTPDGSKIYVTIKSTPESTEVTIKDSGAGIIKEEQAHIFERFYMVDKSRKRELGGNGLGLAIVKKIVDLHKGNIRVESEPDKGAAFIVTIPFQK